MERVECESFWLGLPAFTDEFVWREAFERFEATGEVIRVDEGVEVLLQLVMGLVVVAFDSSFLDGSVHAFDLTVCPRMVDLGEAMFDAVLPAAHVEHVRDILRGWPVGVAWREPKLDAVVGQHGVDFVWDRGDQGFQESGGRHTVCVLHQLREGELAGSIDSDEQIELAFSGLHFSDVDMKVADWVALEDFLRGFVAFDLRQPRDTVSLETTMQ